MKLQIGEGDKKVGFRGNGRNASGLELEFGDADAVFDEEYFFGATFEDVEAAVFCVPFRGGLAELFVL